MIFHIPTVSYSGTFRKFSVKKSPLYPIGRPFRVPYNHTPCNCIAFRQHRNMWLLSKFLCPFFQSMRERLTKNFDFVIFCFFKLKLSSEKQRRNWLMTLIRIFANELMPKIWMAGFFSVSHFRNLKLVYSKEVAEGNYWWFSSSGTLNYQTTTCSFLYN